MSAEPLRGLHVLVVDDNPTTRRLVSAILTHGGGLVTEATSAEAAYRSLERVVPDVITCALDLGGALTAYAFLQRIREAAPAWGRRVPVIAVAGNQEDKHINQVREAGFAGYIKAPLNPRKFCELVGDVADAHRVEGDRPE